MKISKQKLKEMIREEIKEALSSKMEQLEEQRSEPSNVVTMMTKIINAAGAEDFSKEFVSRLGPDYEGELRGVLGYVAKRLN